MTAAGSTREEDLKPFLTASLITHGAVLAAALAASGLGGAVSREVYRIDFIGPTAGIANREPAAAPRQAAVQAPPAQPAAKVPPQQKPDVFSKPRKSQPLPRPSFLGPAEPAKPAQPAAPEATPAAAPAAAASVQATPGAGGAPGGEGSGAAVSADMPNFPYPWYISQVRAQLWAKWTARMPRTPGGVVVMFTILKTGALTDLRVEASSGDDGYDYAALTSVQESAPFAPLPPGFKDRFLKVHVRFTSQ